MLCRGLMRLWSWWDWQYWTRGNGLLVRGNCYSLEPKTEWGSWIPFSERQSTGNQHSYHFELIYMLPEGRGGGWSTCSVKVPFRSDVALGYFHLEHCQVFVILFQTLHIVRINVSPFKIFEIFHGKGNNDNNSNNNNSIWCLQSSLRFVLYINDLIWCLQNFQPFL